MNIISNNLKFLRKNNQLTQEQFAEKIGIKRSLVGAYEEGRADPRLNNLLNISSIFHISVDDLISKDLSKEPGIKQTDAFQKSTLHSSPLKILSITVDQNEKENIELVPQKAAAGYLNGFSDPEYIEQLPRFQLPVLPSTGTYRAFEITGDSMLPLQSGTIVIGKYLEDWRNINSSATYILLSKKEGLVYKRIYPRLEDHGTLLLKSDNKLYDAYEIPVEEVMEIWEAKAYISLTFPAPDAAGEMTIEKLKNIVLELQQEVIKLKK
jgi:transcriptional regulator with XRE-family HTH domain